MPPRLRYFLAACALCAVVLLANVNSFQSGFVLDNGFLLGGDTRIRAATSQNLALILNHTYWWPYAESGLYRPVTTLSYLFNYAILGNAGNPAGYHWINILLHAVNVLLVFALARRLVAEAPDQRLWPRAYLIPNKWNIAAVDPVKGAAQAGFWASFLVAAVWSVHPVLTESVTNIVGRADLLAGMSVLGGLLMYLKSAETSGPLRVAWLSGLTAITALGVFSKESAVSVAGVITLYELVSFDRRRLRGFLLACVAMSPAFLAMWWMRVKVLAAETPVQFPFVDNPIAGAGFWTGRLTALKVMAEYLGLLVWPVRLSTDYSYAQIPLVDGRLTDWIAWLVAALTVAAVAVLYRRNKPAFFAAGFAFVTLLPASNLVIPIGTIMAERFLYLPAVGFAICLVLAIYAIALRVQAKGFQPVLAGALIVAAFTGRTWVRNFDWKDDLTVWSAAVETSPLSFKTHTALAKQILSAKYPVLDQAFSEDEAGLAILDSLPDQRNNAPLYYQIAGQYVLMGDAFMRPAPDGRIFKTLESIAKFERARTLLLRSLSILKAQSAALRAASAPAGVDPEVYTQLMLSQTDQRLGKADEALQSARAAWKLGPMVPAVHQRLHDVLMAMGRRYEAMSAALTGLILTPDPATEQRLVTDYALDPEARGCAISNEKATPQIDFSCPVVRKQVCAVSAAAERLKKELALKYGCGEPQ